MHGHGQAFAKLQQSAHVFLLQEQQRTRAYLHVAHAQGPERPYNLPVAQIVCLPDLRRDRRVSSHNNLLQKVQEPQNQQSF